MKTPQSSGSKKQQQDSIEFTHRPFSDFRASFSLVPSSHDRASSSFSWVDDAFNQMVDTPTPKQPSSDPVPVRLQPPASSMPHRVRVSQSQPTAIIGDSFRDVSSVSPSHTQNTQSTLSNQSAVRGTGAHDDSLARSQGNYRGASLRRGSGRVVETPDGIRRAIEREMRKWNDEDAPESSTQVSLPGSELVETVDEPETPEKEDKKKKRQRKEKEKWNSKSKSPTKAPVAVADETTKESRVCEKDDKKKKQKEKDNSRPPARASVTASSPSSSHKIAKEPELREKQKNSQKKKDKDGQKSPADAPVTASNCCNIAEEVKNREREPLARIINWDEVPHRSQRGDVPPLVVRQPITVEPSSSRLPTTVEKTCILTLCISFWKEYLNLPEALNCTEEPFWTAILQRIEPASRSKFTGWKHLSSSVYAWCEGRRKTLRECVLPPPRDSHRDFDMAIDGWNEIWAQRFTTITKGYFQASIWTAVETKVLSYVQNELYDWINATLEKRRDAIDTRGRDGLCKRNSTGDEYTKTFGHLHDAIKLGGRKAFEVRESEAVMSLMVNIRPGLEKIIRGHMNRENIDGESVREPTPDAEDTDGEVGRS
ncbi:hypothetical protein B0J13DRAFT_285236 [Dactylonectria estremocensis]|uniref:Uncharacterized protein n=1 Tax=Dactylonectria estremocensis TaxID=1079267 RepID=A0A9P9F1L4_9HYPO|nr:hypothetical protein B0J13DRAFT_285236 [Dactylonectria estremocensis]